MLAGRAGRHGEALLLLLQLRAPGGGGYAQRHGLLPTLADHAAERLEADAAGGAALLAARWEEAAPARVVTSLQAAAAAAAADSDSDVAASQIGGAAGAGDAGAVLDQAPPGAPPPPPPLRRQRWRRALHEYLDALFGQDPSAGADFGALQVELYAEFDPGRLLPFLLASPHYPLEHAHTVRCGGGEGAAAACFACFVDSCIWEFRCGRCCYPGSDVPMLLSTPYPNPAAPSSGPPPPPQVCEAHGLVRERVYVLGRMGSADRALRLIMEGLRDVEQVGGAGGWKGSPWQHCYCGPQWSGFFYTDTAELTGWLPLPLPLPLPLAWAQAVQYAALQRDSELWDLLIALALADPELTGEGAARAARTARTAGHCRANLSFLLL